MNKKKEISKIGGWIRGWKPETPTLLSLSLQIATFPLSQATTGYHLASTPSVTRHRREKETTSPLPTRHQLPTTTILPSSFLAAELTRKPTSSALISPPTFWNPATHTTLSHTHKFGSEFDPKHLKTPTEPGVRVWVLQVFEKGLWAWADWAYLGELLQLFRSN